MPYTHRLGRNAQPDRRIGQAVQTVAIEAIALLSKPGSGEFCHCPASLPPSGRNRKWKRAVPKDRPLSGLGRNQFDAAEDRSTETPGPIVEESETFFR